MKFTRSHALIATASAAALTLSACVTNPNTGEREFAYRSAIGAGVGALGGYLLGDLVGGRNDRTAKIIGAGLGAVAGGGVGYYMDQQEQQLREQTAGTGVDVIRDGDNLVLDLPSSITFAVDSSNIDSQFQNTLVQVASTLNEYPNTYVDVLGHTDSTGTDQYNQALSERRADAVAGSLSSQGVNPARIATLGYGESQPKASNSTEEGRAANRRVEIRITPVTQDDVNAIR